MRDPEQIACERDALKARVDQLEQFLLDIPVCEDVVLLRLEKAETERDALRKGEVAHASMTQSP